MGWFKNSTPKAEYLEPVSKQLYFLEFSFCVSMIKVHIEKSKEMCFVKENL